MRSLPSVSHDSLHRIPREGGGPGATGALAAPGFPPSRETRPRDLFIALVVLLPLSLSACGLRGDLERPVPLFGNPPNEGPSDPRTIKAAEEAVAKAEKEKQDAERRAQEAAQPAPAQPATPAPAMPQ